MRVQVATFRERFATPWLRTDVGLFAGVDALVDFEGARAHEGGVACRTSEGPMGSLKAAPFARVAAHVVLEVALGHEATSAAGLRADIRPLSGVHSGMGLEVALFAEGLATALIRTDEGLLVGL